MQLKTFEAISLNHIPKISIDFGENVNFVTGINGSGKTVVLRSIISLLSGNLEALATIQYSKIKIEFRYQGKVHYISAEKTLKEGVKLRCSATRNVFQFFESEGIREYPGGDEADSYYDHEYLSNSHHPVLAFINDIPTPMFLGLDRRYRRNENPYRRRRALGGISRRKKKNIFGAMLGDSLDQAIELAENKYRQTEIQSTRIRKEFVRDLLLQLLDIRVQENSTGFDIPTKKDRQLVPEARQAILQFPKVEGLTGKDIRRKIDPTLQKISDLLEKIPSDLKEHDIRGEEFFRDNISVLSAIMQWESYKPVLNQINEISALITSFNDREKEIRRVTRNYLSMLASFLDDSYKNIGFDERGAISVHSHQDNIGIEELSSGESQIFVLLTHLAFNPDVQDTGVFVIDEPELSLHLLWQEILVDNLLKANSNLQYVMATHSPSIIGDRVEYAIDISKYAGHK
ncbi:unnamed protein product [Ectocarpus sp. 12 AP-2014]